MHGVTHPSGASAGHTLSTSFKWRDTSRPHGGPHAFGDAAGR